MEGLFIRVSARPQPEFGPLTPDHWLVGQPCPRCGRTFLAGNGGVLVPCAEPKGNNVEADPICLDCARKEQA